MFRKIENEKIEFTKELVIKYFKNDLSGHDISHIERVANIAQKISEKINGVNKFIVIASAWLHEMADDKFFKDLEVAKIELTKYMNEHKFTISEIKCIFDIIEHISYSKNIDKHFVLSMEGQIVQDADRLDAIGAIGIGRTFMFGGFHGKEMYTGNIHKESKITKENYRNNSQNSVVQHFYDKLLLLKDQMNTEEAKKIAEHRHRVMEEFLKEFSLEWEGKDIEIIS
jgi:uncharacterized protein